MHFGIAIEKSGTMQHPKGVLIERCQTLGLGKPSFNTKLTGPEHEPTFISDVVIQNEVYGTGQGSNKRDAERHASEEALELLSQKSSLTTLPNKPLTDSDENFTALSKEPFEGPWPIFAEVLAASMTVANSRVDNRIKGDKAITEIRRLALLLYKESLEALGEIMEVEEES